MVTSKRFPNTPLTSLYNPRTEHDACGVGFVARLDAVPAHTVVQEAVEALARLPHRGGSGCGPKTADGAGILLPLPRALMQRVWKPFCKTMPELYGVGQFFLPRDTTLRIPVKNLVGQILEEHGLAVAGWREVPARPGMLLEKALATMPVLEQALVVPSHTVKTSHGKVESVYYGTNVVYGQKGCAEEAFERRLYVARRHVEQVVRQGSAYTPPCDPDNFHIASLSSRSIVYKGMLPGGDLAAFYPDLADSACAAYFAVFHERYSTNTSPSWRLAQPFRCLAHNGEINTLPGNRANMRMREPLLNSPLFGDSIHFLNPVLDETASDSAMLDNIMELLLHSGRTLPHTAMMLLPEPFGQGFIMGEDKRAFYEYHAALMEPWDGPAALVFTDGHRQVGAIMDRNALRPCRYAVTTDGLVVLASEAGVLDLPDSRIAERGRLQPRRMLMADFARHRLVTDAECKGRVIYDKPYRHWVREKGVALRDLPLPPQPGNGVDANPASTRGQKEQELLRSQWLYGFCREEIEDILIPMGREAQEPVASMGLDTPLAVLSQKPQLLFSYLKQRFAQVTNPPIDPLREGLVMTLTGFAGRRGNLLEETPEHYSLLRLANPVLFPEDLQRVTTSQHPAVQTAVLPMLFSPDPANAGKDLQQGLRKLFDAANAALEHGATILLLSDADADAENAPIPSLLAVSALHHYLLHKQKRHACSILVDTGEAREVMHLAQLISFGASGVHPRVAFASLTSLAEAGRLGPGVTSLQGQRSYATALQKGLLKTFSRMGISTLRSFQGGQTFEALGFGRELTDRYFTGLQSRIGGIGLAEIAADVYTRHQSAFSPDAAQSTPSSTHPHANPEGNATACAASGAHPGVSTSAACPGTLPPLVDTGKHRHRAQGERRLWTPTAIRALHKAVRQNDIQSYREYAHESDDQSAAPVTLRGLLRFAPANAIPIEDVEPESALLRRFTGAAMSYGSISPEAHKAVALAFNRTGGRSNCGEGGEDAERLIPLPDGGSTKSKVRQIASGRFGVTAAYLVNADEIQIKMAQGAKPGEGGQLPAHKVQAEIAAVRRTIAGVTLISPPPHHDIYSIEDLAQLVFDLKRLNPAAAVSVKLVAGTNVGAIASGVAKAGADSILISGHDGGTGASPRTAIAHVGLPWEMGLSEAHTALVRNGLRSRVRIQVDGQLRTGKDLAMAALLGADEFGFGTGALVSLGCCMLRLCHMGTCPIGIAAQDAALRAKFRGKADHLEQYLHFLATDLREHMAALGFTRLDDMIGRGDLLEQIATAEIPPQRNISAKSPDHPANTAPVAEAIRRHKPVMLDLSPLLCRACPDEADPVSQGQNTHHTKESSTACPPDSFADSPLETALLAVTLPGVTAKRPVLFEGTVNNTDRALCTRLSGHIARLYGENGLSSGTVTVSVRGTAGQSAGAFLAQGITLKIKGEANDYVGKGLCGGIITVAPARRPSMRAGEQAAIGNVALYGATSGELYAAGSAGERFAVRNSGAKAVVEGVGDHACEYMTGGIVVVLGSTGYNFAAGMSGGVAYVLDRSELFQTRCNMDSVDLESVWQAEDIKILRALMEQHLRHTNSPLAASVLEDWTAVLPLFLKVTPIEYRLALARLKQNEGPHVESIAATEEVFP